MEDKYYCDFCKKEIPYLGVEKLLIQTKRCCSECIFIAKAERQEEEKRSLDEAVENLKKFGVQPLDYKFNPLRLKRNEHAYFFAGQDDGNHFSISLALTTQRLFSTSVVAPKKSGGISLPFSSTNMVHIFMSGLNICEPLGQSSNETILQVQQGLAAISLSNVIAIKTPEHNTDYSAWAIEVHLTQGKNLGCFFRNSQGVNRFYALLSEMVDRLNDPIDYTVFSPRRERILDEVKIAVWRRDNGCCVRCGSRENLEYDHIIPISRGGSNTLRNIELLCERCNRIKSNKIT